MLTYISSFTTFERNQFLKLFTLQMRPTTVCKTSAILRGKGNSVLKKIQRRSSAFKRHAEVNALNYVVKQLQNEVKINKPLKNNSTTFDLTMRLNNSPCSDCQRFISGKILEIQKMFSQVHFKLILFFSNFYRGTHNFKDALDIFTQWIMLLTQSGTVVILCPIIIHQMIPSKKSLSNEKKKKIEKLDLLCIRNFRKILKNLKLKNASINVATSHCLFCKQIKVNMSLFTWKNPQCISVKSSKPRVCKSPSLKRMKIPNKKSIHNQTSKTDSLFSTSTMRINKFRR